jgi:hypothetical protein
LTSALLCDRNPKFVAAELGHTTSRVVVENYDSFLDPRNWPDGDEVTRLRAVYGGEERQPQAPLWYPDRVSALTASNGWCNSKCVKSGRL